MCDNTSDVVRLDSVQKCPLFDFDAELLPEITVLAQCLQEDPFRPVLMHTPQSSHSSSDCFYRTDPRLVLDPSVSRTSIREFSSNTPIQNVTAQWRASTMGLFPFSEPPAPNELTVSYRSEMCEDDLVTERHPPFMTSPIPLVELLGTEALRDQPGVSPISSPISPGGFEESASESLSQAGSQSPSQECYILWKKIPISAIVVTGTNKFVPQRLYRPFTETDKERYLERVSLSAPIIFVTKGPVEWGISLEDVRNGKTQGLVDKNVPVLQDCGPSVTIRINWPGYPSFKFQIPSRNWRKMKGPITKEKLAQSLAKATGRFVEKMSNKPLEDGAQRSWKVGPQHIKVEDLILVSLHHVSKGSWQPQFRLRLNHTSTN